MMQVRLTREEREVGEYSREVRETLERLYYKRERREHSRGEEKKFLDCNSLHNCKVIFEQEFLEKIEPKYLYLV